MLQKTTLDIRYLSWFIYLGRPTESKVVALLLLGSDTINKEQNNSSSQQQPTANYTCLATGQRGPGLAGVLA